MTNVYISELNGILVFSESLKDTMRRKLFMLCIVLLILTAFGQEGVFMRVTLEDGSSVPISEADAIARFKDAEPLSDYINSIDIDTIPIEDKIDIKHLMHKPRYSLRPPEVNY